VQLPALAQQLEPVTLGHAQIGEDEIERLGTQSFECCAPRRRRFGFVAFVGKDLGNDLTLRGFVVDDQDAQARRVHASSEAAAGRRNGNRTCIRVPPPAGLSATIVPP
jgi:hypothetical protein